MPMPKSVTRINKKGVKFISDVNRASYTITELSRAALRDSAKFVRRRMLDEARKQHGHKKGKRIPNAFQYWLRRREGDLQIGLKHNTWYSAEQELGTNNQPKKGIMRKSVFENIDQIRIIQGKYLSAIEDENRAKGLIDESEATGDDE